MIRISPGLDAESGGVIRISSNLDTERFLAIRIGGDPNAES